MVARTHDGILAALLAALPLVLSPSAYAQEARLRSDAAQAADAAGWQDPATWKRLRLGMSQLDVLRILGEPGKVTRYYAFERWEYPDALGQRVNFDERGRLIAWGRFAR